MDYQKCMEDNFEFGKLYTIGQKSDNPVWQKALDGLRQKERGWRRLPNYIKSCGHPGVRDSGNRCVFCLIERDESRAEQAEQRTQKTRAGYVSSLCEQADALEQQARVKADKMRKEADDILWGRLPWPPVGSPRQQAIAMGEKWYMSPEPCRYCNQLSERYVANGRCRNCGK